MGKSKDLATGAAYQDQTESDTRYVNASGDTMTGNLGINSGSTVSSLNVGNTSDDGVVDYTKGIVFNDTLATVSAINGDSTPWVHAGIVTTGSAGFNGNLIFATDGNSARTANTSGLTERMRIDHAGRVTMPSQPGFSAYRDAGHVTAGNVYIFDHTYYNVGNMYNSSTGRATVPIAGRYLVTVWLMSQNDAAYNNKYIRLRINTNNPAYKNLYSSTHDATHHQFSWSGVINLSANDYVDIYVDNMTVYGVDNKYSNFSMQLLS